MPWQYRLFNFHWFYSGLRAFDIGTSIHFWITKGWEINCPHHTGKAELAGPKYVVMQGVWEDRSNLVVGGVDSQAWGKSIWWMPWHIQAMKDVARCDKRWGDVSNLWSSDFRMGEPILTILLCYGSFLYGAVQIRSKWWRISPRWIK